MQLDLSVVFGNGAMKLGVSGSRQEGSFLERIRPNASVRAIAPNLQIHTVRLADGFTLEEILEGKISVSKNLSFFLPYHNSKVSLRLSRHLSLVAGVP